MQRLAKTDRIDAATLAEFAGVLARRADCERFIRPLSEPEQQELAALVTRRRQLVTMQLSERQRLRLARPVTRPSIEALLEAIARLRQLFPEWRLGQLVANLTTAAGCQEAEAIWDVEDEELLSAARSHLKELSERHVRAT